MTTKKPLTAEQIKKLQQDKATKKLTGQTIVKDETRNTTVKR